MPKKKPSDLIQKLKQKFTQEDVEHLLEDLRLYSGNITEITDLSGPSPDNGGWIYGLIHTGMHKFRFSTAPMFCNDESWAIGLVDAVDCLRGNGSLNFYRFPKLHLHPDLQQRYQIANLLYRSYNGYDKMSESWRLPHYEKDLGYDKLPTAQHVLNAIIADFRSFKQPRRTGQFKVHENN